MAGPNRRNRGTSEKPKDIKKALSRIVKELRKYYFLIILAIVLSTIASIIAIFTPNMISSITNKITVGLKIDEEKAKEIVTIIYQNQQKEVVTPITIDDVLISTEDQYNILALMNSVEDENSFVTNFSKIPTSIQNLIVQKIDLTGIKKIAIVLIVLYLISALFNYIESIAMTDVSNKFGYDLRKNISLKIPRKKWTDEKNANPIPINWKFTSKDAHTHPHLTNLPEVRTSSFQKYILFNDCDTSNTTIVVQNSIYIPNYNEVKESENIIDLCR